MIMPTFHRGFELPSLPFDIAEAVRRRLREAGGLALVALAALAAAALLSWSVQDPSLSHATSAPVRNLLGAPGAIAADLMMQIMGLASIALIAPIAAWGWRLLSHRALDREGLRVGLWLCAVVLAAGFAACLPRSAAWPLPTGLGGVIGDALLRAPALALGPLSAVSRLGIALMFGCSALAAIQSA